MVGVTNKFGGMGMKKLAVAPAIGLLEVPAAAQDKTVDLKI